jgi:hypothetical protein
MPRPRLQWSLDDDRLDTRTNGVAERVGSTNGRRQMRCGAGCTSAATCATSTTQADRVLADHTRHALSSSNTRRRYARV